MKKHIIISSLLSFIFSFILISCEEAVEVVDIEATDTTPPTISILSPANGSIFTDSLVFSCETTDDVGIEKVELWVDTLNSGSNQYFFTGIYDNSEPYVLEWNTVALNYGDYNFILRSYDNNGNYTDSDSLILRKDKMIELWGEQYSVYSTTEIVFEGENLSGSIPSEIGDFINLEILILSHNNLSGNIPLEIGNLSNLIKLKLGYNQLTDSIPANIFELTNLTHLYLNDNPGLLGTIPPEIGNLINLRTINLWCPGISGTIPPEIGNLSNLVGLFLGSNLTGSIPPEIGNLTNLSMLALNNNNLTGTIPSEIGNLTSLTKLDLFRNNLTGVIPSEIGNLINLNHLNLYHNNLEGIIPESICNLNSFDITDNNLCPPYPSCIDNVGNQDTSNCN